MPPVATDDKSVIRWLTRLLSAITIEMGGELHIPAKTVRMLESEDSRQMLSEEGDLESDEIVLRFSTKHSAIYPVESEACHSRMQPSSPPLQPQPVKPPQARPPMNDQDLAAIEKKIRQMRVMREMEKDQARRQREQRDLSLEILEGGSRS